MLRAARNDDSGFNGYGCALQKTNLDTEADQAVQILRTGWRANHAGHFLRSTIIELRIALEIAGIQPGNPFVEPPLQRGQACRIETLGFDQSRTVKLRECGDSVLCC